MESASSEVKKLLNQFHSEINNLVDWAKSQPWQDGGINHEKLTKASYLLELSIHEDAISISNGENIELPNLQVIAEKAFYIRRAMCPTPLQGWESKQVNISTILHILRTAILGAIGGLKEEVKGYIGHYMPNNHFPWLIHAEESWRVKLWMMMAECWIRYIVGNDGTSRTIISNYQKILKDEREQKEQECLKPLTETKVLKSIEREMKGLYHLCSASNQVSKRNNPNSIKRDHSGLCLEDNLAEARRVCRGTHLPMLEGIVYLISVVPECLPNNPISNLA